LHFDVAYELTLDTREFDALSGNEVREAGQKVGDMVSRLDLTCLPKLFAAPIRWSIRRVQPGEYEDERTGIMVVQEQPMMLENIDGAEAREGTVLQMKGQLEAAAAKFEGYSSCRRLVLLDFYGTDLWEDDIPALLKGMTIPVVVDEVWRTIRDWISPDDYEIGYERIHNS
jgi:hypothetical protein